MREYRALLFVGLLAFAATMMCAQTPLRTLSGPQGGTIVYGTVDGASTPPAAMGSILRQLHAKYGDRPQVGRVFKVRGTDSDAVFFTLTRHTPTTANVAGMLLVSSVPGHVEAALVTDDAARFGTSINPMLQTLFASWHPGGKSLSGGGGQRAEASEGASGPVAPLRPYRLQDGSAAVMLAEGWRVAPQSGGGTILAQGPHGETLALGFPYLAQNSNSAQGQRTRAFAQSPQGRNTMYAKALYAPYGADLGRTFADLNAQARRMGAPAVAPVQVTQSQPLRGNGANCAYLAGNAQGDGGPLQFEGTFCQGQDTAGGFMNLANLSFAPAEFATRDRATLRAMLSSFQVNQAKVNAQAAALAAPTVAAVHAIGDQVNARIAASDKMMDERRKSFDEHNDVMDRTSQGFSNYMLDKSVILDNQNNAHGTTWNSTAQALVESDPKRFEYVDTPGYWRGIDY